MNRTELERAWPATEPSPGFADRVVERAHCVPRAPESVPPRAARSGWLSTRRARWLALPAVALAALLLFWLARPTREGDVIAAEPRVVAIGERALAEMSNGAHIRWSGDEVEQESGEVTYRVERGADFRVQTPYGSVAVLGTVFTVVVADRAVAGGDPMKKEWTIAGASATLGALLVVSVDQGSVRLSKGKDEVILRAGQSGAIGADGVPRLESDEPVLPESVQGTAERDAERARARRVADAVRRHAARRREALQAANGAAGKPLASSATPTGSITPTASAPARPVPTPEEEEHRREYIQRTMREQYYPVVRDCYQELLERQPTARGRVTLEFAIVGDGDAGVVDRVATRDDETTIDDPEFVLCMRESLYTAVFEPPLPGASETTIVYPIMLAPE